MLSFNPRWIKFLLVAVFAIFATTIAVRGQGVTGSVVGRVTDSSGAVVPGASVEIQSSATGFSQKVQTDNEGRYSLSNLAPGTYDVTIAAAGFQTQVKQGIVLTVAAQIAINVELTVGSAQERVVVTAENPQIETTNATISSLVSSEQIRDLPLNGRSLDQLALLNPGIFVSRYTQNVSTLGRGMRISVDGGRQDANVYLLDGTVVNDHAANGPNSAGGNALGVDGILEYRVLAHNFSAEYGRNSGAVVSMVTRSGTNDLHASIYEFVRNTVFNARNFFNPGGLPAYHRNQFGGSLGGAVKKDRIFYFANYEELRANQGKTFIATVPDLNARKGIINGVPVTTNQAALPYVNMYPLPNGPIFADGTAQSVVNINVPTSEHYGLARMDFRLTEKDNFYWRYNTDTGQSLFPRPGNITADQENGAYHYVTFSEAHIFSPTAVNEFRVAFNRNDPWVTSIGIDPRVDFCSLGFVPGMCFGGITYSVGNQGGGGGSGASQQLSGVEIRAPNRHFVQNLYEENDAFSLVHGPHSLKFGGDFERIQLNFPAGVAGGTYQFAGLNSLLAGTPTQFTFTPAAPEDAWRRNLFAWFVQDDYRVRPNLTINVGVRHEFFTTPVELDGRQANLLNPTDSAVTKGAPFHPGQKNFSPRFGLAWDPFKDGKTSIRAGAGIFYNFVDGRTWYMGVDTTTDAIFGGGLSVKQPPFPQINPAAFGFAPKSVYVVGANGLLKEPTVAHYNLEVQRQLTSTLTLRAGYIGALGWHMGRLASQNIRIPSVQANGTLLFPASGAVVNSNFNQISALLTDGHYNYNAFQTVVTKSLSHGLMVSGNYTWGKAMSNADEVGAAESNGIAPTTYNIFNLKQDYSLSTFDQRHTLVINGRYQLPFDKSLRNSVVRAVFGGWSLNGLFTASSGQPFNIQTGFNNSQNNDPQQTDRPNLVAGFSNNPTSGTTGAGCTGVAPNQKLGTPNLWFNPCAFVLQIPGTFGNLGRNTVTAPGQQDIDATLMKDITVREKIKIQFRAEVFNLMNHANFTLPTRVIFNPDGSRAGSSGIISSTQGDNREMQLGLKLSF